MADTREKTILIVDDEEVVAESYQLYLEDKYETRIETTGGAALAELDPTDREIDLILLDRRMPGMSGDVVANHVDDYELDYQVLMVSAVDPDLDILDIPCDGYLTKPVSEEEIVTAVERAFLVSYYKELITEYNAVVEKYDVLVDQFSKEELSNKELFTEFEERMEQLESEISETTEELEQTNMQGVFLPAP